MKKYITIAALLATSNVAFGADLNWDATLDYELTGITTIGHGTIGNTSGYIITKTGTETSPGEVTMEMEFSLDAFGSSSTEHLISFGANDGSASNAYGFIISNEGQLSFGRLGTDNLTSTTAPVTIESAAACAENIAKLSLNTSYTLTLVSKASVDSSGNPGRGEDNFVITLFDGTNTISETSGGFAMNGSYFANLRIGSGITNTTLSGTVTSLSLVPEPSAFGLLAGLGALALVASRRRRK